MTRDFQDEDGNPWQAIAIDAVVAHGRKGALLAFRPAEGASPEVISSSITFNSVEAADFALRTLGEKELRRRLSMARAEL